LESGTNHDGANSLRYTTLVSHLECGTSAYSHGNDFKSLPSLALNKSSNLKFLTLLVVFFCTDVDGVFFCFALLIYSCKSQIHEMGDLISSWRFVSSICLNTSSNHSSVCAATWSISLLNQDIFFSLFS
jgi:hypothetical protein